MGGCRRGLAFVEHVLRGQSHLLQPWRPCYAAQQARATAFPRARTRRAPPCPWPWRSRVPLVCWPERVPQPRARARRSRAGACKARGGVAARGLPVLPRGERRGRGGGRARARRGRVQGPLVVHVGDGRRLPRRRARAAHARGACAPGGGQARSRGRTGDGGARAARGARFRGVGGTGLGAEGGDHQPRAGARSLRRSTRTPAAGPKPQVGTAARVSASQNARGSRGASRARGRTSRLSASALACSCARGTYVARSSSLSTCAPRPRPRERAARPRPSRCTVHRGCRVQDAGCRTQDAGRRMQDAGCRMQDAGCRMQDVGCRM
jgi:hypothetical protein